jgi:hypothetical protein
MRAERNLPARSMRVPRLPITVMHLRCFTQCHPCHDPADGRATGPYGRLNVKVSRAMFPIVFVATGSKVAPTTTPTNGMAFAMLTAPV